MITRRPSHTALVITAGAVLAFGVWTALVALNLLDGVDEGLRAPTISSTGWLTQIAEAIAVLTWPGVIYLGLAIGAWWAYRRRLRQLATALVLVIPYAWGGVFAFGWVLRRARPPGGSDLITAIGFAYPSGHLVAVTTAVVMVTAGMLVTRRGADTIRGWQVLAPAIVALIALDRWVLDAHWVSDIVGGFLLAGVASAAALLTAGVRVLPPELRFGGPAAAVVPDPEAPRQRCAVIYNPIKITDLPTFQRHVEYELSSRGWERAIWLETTVDDPGAEMTAIAVRKRVDLVIGAGGDGTTRIICAGLAHTGTPLGLIPAGTGNLLAKNLGIPLDERAALDVAFNGVDTAIDLVRLTVNNATHYFSVMAGIGIDAVIMDATNADLKRAVGSAAYFVAAARHANHPPVMATVQVDGGAPFKRRAKVIVIGNVGFLQANIQLIPGARADDGLLDLMIASPRSAQDWVRLTTTVLARRRRDDEQLDRIKAKTVSIKIDRPDMFQLDGDTVGSCDEMTAEVQPGALTLRMRK